MNAKTLSSALMIAIVAGSALFSTQAFAINTLDTVQVRPSAEQIAQRDAEAASGIRTLATVTVRPSAEQVAQYNAEQAMQRKIVTLAAVTVRPSPEQIAERDRNITTSSFASNRDQFASDAVVAAVSLIGAAIVTLPTVQMRPSASDLATLTEIASVVAGTR